MDSERTREDLCAEIGILREQSLTTSKQIDELRDELKHYKTRTMRAEVLLATLADKLAEDAE